MLLAQGVFTERELQSRYEIQLENYVHSVRIEARTMVDMAQKMILPAAAGYTAMLADGLQKKEALGLSAGYEKNTAVRLAELEDSIFDAAKALEGSIAKLDSLADVTESSAFVRDSIIPEMETLRAAADEAETLTAAAFWPFPTYGELLFGV